MKKILVIGGAGYIGSHVNKLLGEKGYQTVVLDNLSRGNRGAVVSGELIEGDMSDPVLLSGVMKRYQFDAVMHFAALTDVGESFMNPTAYYKNNVSATLTVLDMMQKHQIPIFIFSSSAAIYGEPREETITEAHPCSPINPYGQTKLMVEQVLTDYGRAFGMRSSCLRYFNAAGGDPERKVRYFPRKESNLIPLILTRMKNGGSLTMNGTDYPTADGTCVRDYVHVMDLGHAHIAAMEHLLDGGPSTHYNLGNGKGFSIKEVIEAAEKIVGKKIPVTIGSRRPGDPPVLVANASKAAKELGWKPRYSSLEEMIRHAWNAME